MLSHSVLVVVLEGVLCGITTRQDSSSQFPKRLHSTISSTGWTLVTNYPEALSASVSFSVVSDFSYRDFPKVKEPMLLNSATCYGT